VADGNHFDVGQQAMANLGAYDAGVKAWVRAAAICLEVTE
jgi:hypothetical protein